MITPAYAPTATERVLPRMALDFTTGVLDPRVTVARSLNTATRVNSSGLIEIVNANLPRFDYDPVTLAPKGLLIEEQRVNLATYSQDFSGPAWSKSSVTVTADTTVAPDGTTTADTLTASSITGFTWQVVSFTGDGDKTMSCFVKAGTAATSVVQIRDATISANRGYFIITWTAGVPSVVRLTTGTVLGVDAFPDGWYRLRLLASNVVAANSNQYRFLPDTTAGTGTVIAWGAQAENGAFATSYIPTTTTSVTRNADQVVMTGANFSDWYNASQGTLMAEASTFSNAATDKFVANINNNGFPNRILMNFTATNNFSASLVSNSISQVSGTNGVAAALNTPTKMCFATKLNSFAFSQSGVAPTTDNLGVMPVTVDRLWIGSAFTSAFLNGHMRQIKYWPQRLINAETQAFSK
jgi:hypothetical protein